MEDSRVLSTLSPKLALFGVQLSQTFYNNDVYAAQFPHSYKTPFPNLDVSNETFYSFQLLNTVIRIEGLARNTPQLSLENAETFQSNTRFSKS